MKAAVERFIELEQRGGMYAALAAIAPPQIGEIIPEADSSELAKKVIDILMKVEGRPNTLDRQPPYSSIVAWVALLSPFIKDEAFSEECEWRKLISKDYRPMPGIQYRMGKSTLIPFVEIMLGVMRVEAGFVTREKYFINEVIVGPTPAPELTIEALTSLFASEGQPQVTVRPSRVPFRNW